MKMVDEPMNLVHCCKIANMQGKYGVFMHPQSLNLYFLITATLILLSPSHLCLKALLWQKMAETLCPRLHSFGRGIGHLSCLLGYEQYYCPFL